MRFTTPVLIDFSVGDEAHVSTTSDAFSVDDWLHVKVTQNFDAKQASWVYQVYFNQILKETKTHQSPRATLTDVKVVSCHETQTCDALKIRNVKYTTSACKMIIILN